MGFCLFNTNNKSKVCPLMSVNCQSLTLERVCKKLCSRHGRKKSILSGSIAFPTFRIWHFSSHFHVVSISVADAKEKKKKEGFHKDLSLIFFPSLYCSPAHKPPRSFLPRNSHFSNTQYEGCLGM